MRSLIAILTQVAALTVTMAVARGVSAKDTDAVAHFENHVRPLFVEHCVQCHGPKKSESSLRLDSSAAARKGGASGPAVVPGRIAQSLIIQAVRHEDGLEMPPEKKLADREINALVRWIEQGAVWPDGMTLGGDGPSLRGGPITDAERAFWSLQPITDPAPPPVDSSRRVRNGIDRFLHAKLQEAGMQMRSPAAKRALIRRATYDLTGLPPTPAEVAAFLEDDSADAFATVVERLLDSPQYGERWGRHWLDVVRYADTAGETGDYPTPLSYKYRNWVIEAFNRDLPYDQFVRQQVAGDILADRMIAAGGGKPAALDAETLRRYEQMLTATGFIAISRRFGFDVENYHHLTIQDTIDTLGQAVLGLSLGCARCHDHKYDPVNINDYYAWYGIFESTRYSFPGSEQKKRSYDSFPVLPPALAAQRKEAYDARTTQLDEELKRLQAVRESAEAKLNSADGFSVFAGFERQPLGKGLPEPWGTLEDVQVVEAAQSPYENVFLRGSRGLKMPSNADNNAFGRGLAMPHTPATTPRLHYNIDFQLPEVADNGGGAFRFYLGRGPGNSAAVEMSASASTFFVKNGQAYEPVCELKLGQWYNLQVTADLRKRTFSGAIATHRDVTAFRDQAFTAGWDGTIDRTFVDKFGARGGVLPGRHFDNLQVSTSPLLPLGQSIDDHPDVLAATQWRSYLEQRRLLQSAADRDGHAGFQVWHGNPLPIVGVNTSDKELTVPGTVPPGTFVLHPNPKEGVGVAWRSPLAGRVRVRGRVQDAHDCGDSVAWHIDHLSLTGFAAKAEGAIDRASAQPLGGENRRIELDMKPGEFIQLAVMPKANHGCDLTQVGLVIEELGGEGRTWDLVSDVKDDLVEGNPNDGQHGGSPWFFYTVAEDRGQSVAVGAAARLAAKPAAELRRTVEQTAQQIARLTKDQMELKAAGPYQVIYGAIEQDEPKDAQIRIRGERRKLGDSVPRKNLNILGNDPLPTEAGSGRLQMADWLTRGSNPLTARVMANRIWQQHFGRGLVGTENDFGTRGQRPSHPQLLDWLASRFVERGWSVKAMHRLIMNSAAYQQSSDFDAAAAEADPDARLLWRFNRRRLSAEEIRDAMLLVSGQLDSTADGEHPFPPEDTWGFSQHAPYYGVYPSKHRSVYLMQQRLKRHPFLSLFDGADVNVPTARRELTTVPTQALYLMNSEFVHQQSMGLAGRIVSHDGGKARMSFAYNVTLGRAPRTDEAAAAIKFLAAYRESLDDSDEAEVQAWAGLARTLLTRNEFLFVD